MKPFLRWVGGKKKLVDEIRPWLPEGALCYHEPFLGSGALFFATAPPCAILSDSNPYLVRTFNAIKNDVSAVIASLTIYADAYTAHGVDFYYHVREQLSLALADAELAAVFVFLNKTNFNGLFRVNASDRYNVPAGKFTSPPNVCDESALLACSEALQGSNATILCRDFREVTAAAGDFCYFDSPYAAASATSDFTSYTKEKFGPPEQKALRDLALRLKSRGVCVILSNSDTPLVRELYAGWEIKEISRKGTVSSKVDGRGTVRELLIR